MELVAFVESVVARLIHEEELCSKTPSSLRFFCRVDIAVVYNLETRAYQYMVNEVARNMCCLFAKQVQPLRLLTPMVRQMEFLL